jgi:opacity protein-like surface antigen
MKENQIMQRRLLAGAVLGLLLLCTSVARADEGSKQEISAQGTGFFTKDSSGTTSTGDKLTQHSTNNGGLLLSYRYHFKSWLGADVSYGYGRNEQEDLVTFAPGITPILGPGPVRLAAPIPFNVQTNVHQATAAFVVTVPRKPFHLNPYLLAGSGALVFAPTDNRGGTVIGATTQARPTFVYGGGVDYNLGRHLAVRLEYRGFVYKRPSFGLTTLNSGVEAYTSQPSAGVVWHF